MLEFTKLQKGAKELSQAMTQHFTSKQSCTGLGLFSSIVLSNSTIDDASIISTIASCLDDKNDKSLLAYIEKLNKIKDMPPKDFVEFKKKVLVGIYLLKWCQYNPILAILISNPLVARFKKDLEIDAPREMDVLQVDESLNALSQFFSYVHDNKKALVLDELNQSVGKTIQVDIHNMRRSLFAEDSSWLGDYEKANTLGMK